MLSVIATELGAWLLSEAIELPVYFGKDFLAQFDAANRVVMVPTTDDWGDIESPGGNPRPLATRNAGADVYVHAEDAATCEALVHQVFRGLREAARTCLAVTGGEWNNDIKLNEHGAIYVLKIKIAFSVTDAAYAVAPSDLEARHTGVMEITSGESTSGCASEG